MALGDGSLGQPSVVTNPALMQAAAAAAAAAAAQAQLQSTRHLRMLYVGNLPPNQSQRELIDFFNAQFAATGIAKGGNPTPVVGMQYTPINQFGFIEFAEPEDATTGLALDGLNYKGNSLKIRRPKSYQQAFPG
jgi:splicing factor U2AF subunit